MRSDVAVLFDLDGVIVDSRPHHLSAWHQLAREAALAHAPDYFTRTFGLRNEPIIRGLAPDIDPGRLRALADRKEQLFRGAARGNLELLPGVRELLAFLDEQDVPKAIVTSAPRANLDMAVEALGIGGHFQALVAEEDAAKGKPDPEGFLVAASRAGVEPSRLRRDRRCAGGGAGGEERWHARDRRHNDAPGARPRRRRPRRRFAWRGDRASVHTRVAARNGDSAKRNPDVAHAA